MLIQIWSPDTAPNNVQNGTTRRPKWRRWSDIRVIVPAGKPCRQRFIHDGAAAGWIAVRSDSNSDARPADSDSAFGPTIRNCLGQESSEAGIVHAFRPVGAEVDDLVSLFAKPGGEFVFE